MLPVAMLTTVASLSSLFAAIGTLLLGMGLMGTLLAVRAGVEAFPDVVTGLVMGAYFAGYIVGAYLCPFIIQRVGHIRAFSAMASVGSTTAILHAIFVDPWAWGVLRLVTGACMVGLYMVIESWMNTLTPSEKRGRVFALYMMVSLVALGFGQFLILLGDVRSFVNFGVVSVFMSLALVPIAMTRVIEPTPVRAPRLSLVHLFRRSPTGAVGAFSAGVTAGAFWGMGPLFGHRIGLSELGIAALMSAVIFGGALLQWPIGHLSDRHDRRTVLVGVCTASAAVALALFVLRGAGSSWLLAGAFLYGGLAFTVYGLAVAHVNDMLDPASVLQATKGLLLLHGLGASLGPIVSGQIMASMGPGSLLIFVAAVFLLTAVFGLYRGRVTEPAPVEEQTDFVPMARTSPAVLEMDPRVDDEEKIA